MNGPSVQLITQNSELLSILDQIRQVSLFNSSILITGESGVGKDLLAEYCHLHGTKREKALTKIDCASIPPDLFESELFGHERGSFTGAVRQKAGRLEIANGGSIYFDQISELPLGAQAKLTRIVQDRCFERVGGTESIHLDAHILASSRFDLFKLVKQGLFREDLYYRLNVVGIHIPPLRNRRDDIPLLIQYYLHHFSNMHRISEPQISDLTTQHLQLYDWPGNVRELVNLIEQIVVSNAYSGINAVIRPNMLPARFHPSTLEMIESAAAREMTLDEIERIYIRKILESTHGNKSHAAQILGINRKTLLEKRRKYGIE